MTMRLLSSYGAVVFALILGVVLVVTWQFRKTSNAEIDRLASTTSLVVAKSVQRVSFSGRYHTRLLLEELAADSPGLAYLIVLDSDGRVFAHSDPGLNDTIDTSKAAARACTVFAQGRTVFQTVEIDGVPVLEVDVPLVGGYPEGIQGVVRVGISLASIIHQRRVEFITLILASLSVAAAAMLVLYRLSSSFAAPVQNMALTLEGILDHAPQVIYLQDRSGHLTQRSSNFPGVFGGEDGYVPDSVDAMFGDHEVRDTIRDMDAEVFASAKALGKEIELGGEGKLRQYLVTKFPVAYDRGSDVAGICTFMLDVTDRRQLEAQLVQSQKMEAIGHLAGGVAHDFNNLLTAIIGHAEMMSSDLGDREDLREDLESLLAAANRAAGLTGQLLAFSRKQVIRPVALDLNHAVEEMKSLLVRVIGENIVLDCQTGKDEALTILADRTHLDQILLNLATNARDAMPRGGHLTIRTWRESVTRPVQPAVGDPPGPGSYGVLEIRDTGQGMDSRTMGRIFEPFFTTKDVGKGTGLGLSMVFGLVKQHNGAIVVSSEVGRGTGFRIYLPLADSSPEKTVVASAEENRRPSTAHPRTGRILLVEDDAIVRGFLERALTGAGYRVITAATGEEGLHRFDQAVGEFDVVLLDIVMPGMNGLEAMNLIRSRDSQVRFILMSGYLADVVAAGHPLDPDVPFLAKPIALGTLLKELERIMESVDSPGN
ncbi:MAG: ATP-binding protein [Candidatus Krumholzibacteriia bacterium]